MNNWLFYSILIFLFINLIKPKREIPLKLRALDQFLEAVKSKEIHSNLKISSNKDFTFKCICKNDFKSMTYSFILSSDKGLCLNRIFDNVDILADIIKKEVDNVQIHRDGDNIINLNIWKNLKKHLLFAYTLNFFYTRSHLNKKLKFKIKKFSNDDREVLENLASDNLNILNFDENDFNVVSGLTFNADIFRNINQAY
jgi:hypothetical protein